MFSSNIDDNEIKKRMDNFRNNIEKGVNKGDVTLELMSIFGDNYICPVEMKIYDIGTPFYRVRSIPSEDICNPFKTISRIEDAWEPPEYIIKTRGRLNNINESILYCCPDDFELAIDEARARDNSYIAIMVYKSYRKIKYTVLGDYENSSLPKDNKTKLLYSFLNEEFSIVVANGEENRYSITHAIANSYFSYPEQDAWCYRSIQSSKKFNVAFLPKKSKDCLNLMGVIICNPKKLPNGNYNVKYVIDFDKVSNNIRYHKIDSEWQKKIFPEIINGEVSSTVIKK